MGCGCVDIVASTLGLRRLGLGAGLREQSHRLLAEFWLRLAIHAREEVTPTDVVLMDSLADEPPVLALGTQRRCVGLNHRSSTVLGELSGFMKKVSVDEPASLRNGKDPS
jgi:hypothetical protein